MISFSNVVDRALTGPICTERDFELGIFVPNLRKIVEKYDIKYDPQNPVSADDDLADRVWEAGLEFLSETGVFCTDTERRITFTREEIDGALATAPRPVLFGDGKDTRAVPLRRPEDKTPPWCSGSGAGPVSTEQILFNVVKLYAQDPLSDGITAPAMSYVDGRDLIAGSPRGLEGAIRTILLTREALRRAGRPGMPVVNEVATAVRAQEHIAGHRFGSVKTDYLEIGTTHELKVDFDALNRVAYWLAAGSHGFAENGVILGGLSGGPAGVAVVIAAYNPVDMLVLRGAVQHPFAVPFEGGTTSNRGCMWARNLATQAITRHSPMPLVTSGYSAAGAMTRMAYYEFTAWVIGCVVSGASVELGPPLRGTALDHSAPLEDIFGNAVAHAAVGLSRREANQILKALLEEYEAKLADPPLGKRYQECYDLATGEPVKEAVDLCRDVRREMSDRFGLELPRVSPYF